MLKSVYLCAAALCIAAPASAAVEISYEAQGVFNTTAEGTFAVEDFDHQATGFQRDFTDVISDGLGSVSFTYDDVNVRAHDQFGGNGSGNYGATYNGIGFAPVEGPTFSLNVASTSGPINFFGAYFSATDASNTISFYNGNALIQSVQLGSLWHDAGIGDQGSVFVNFKFTEGQTFSKIVFNQPNSPYGFESDNHTIGTWGRDSNVELGVPEPASWALMLGGFGLVGAALRRRRTATAFG